MSRPRFLADHDLNEHIVDGAWRREPAVEVLRARELGLHERSDPEVLAYAAEHALLIVSHDVNPMPGHVCADGERAVDGRFADGPADRSDRPRDR